VTDNQGAIAFSNKKFSSATAEIARDAAVGANSLSL